MNNFTKNDIEGRNEIITKIKLLSNRFSNIRDELCEPYGLSSTQAIIILDIYHNPKESKVTDICKRLHKSTNTISPLINRLTEKGYLKKVQSKSDARVTNIVLTEKCKKITDNIFADIDNYAWPMFDSISDEEFEKISSSLDILLRVFKG